MLHPPQTEKTTTKKSLVSAPELEKAIAEASDLKDWAIYLESLLIELKFWTENPEINTLRIYTGDDRLKTVISFSCVEDRQAFESRSGLSTDELYFGDKLEVFLWGESQAPYFPETRLTEKRYYRFSNVEGKLQEAIAQLKDAIAE
jgi:hypothetical protein